MKLMTALSFALMSLSLIAGIEGGGGGGGICYPERCVTLAEAGLRIDIERTREFEIEMEVIQEINSLLEKIPHVYTIGLTPEVVIGRKDTFVLVTPQEEASFERFKKEYFEILESEKFPTEGFNLLAVSEGSTKVRDGSVIKMVPLEGGVTYLLPGYELLSNRSKALLLIHEALIRDFLLPVKFVLKFDDLVLDFLRSLEHGQEGNYDKWPLIDLYRQMNDFWLTSKQYQDVTFEKYYRDHHERRLIFFNNELVRQLIRDNGPIHFKELCPDLLFPKTSHYDWKFTFYCRISRQRALELRKYRPDFAKHLSDQTIILTAVNAENLFNSSLDRLGGTESEFEEVKDDFVRHPCKKNPKLPEFLYSPGNWYMSGQEGVKAIAVLNKCI